MNKQQQELLAHAAPSREVSIKKLDKPYQAGVVEILEYLLERAKNGEIDTITIFYRQGVECHHAYSGNDDLIAEIGAMDRLKYIMHKRINGEA